MPSGPFVGENDRLHSMREGLRLVREAVERSNVMGSTAFITIAIYGLELCFSYLNGMVLKMLFRCAVVVVVVAAVAAPAVAPAVVVLLSQ